MTLKIKKLVKDAKIPKYSHEGDAAFDLYTCKETILPPMQRVLVSTGISMAIPTGHVGLIWDRSGHAAKAGLTTMGGVIDSNYRGEVKVIIFNTTNESYKIKKGERIAQMIIQKFHPKKIIEVKELDNTTRGIDGFGSSGKI